MDNQQTNTIKENTYLVTQKCDIASLSDKQRTNDLEALKAAEEKSQKRIDVTFGKADSQTTRAMKALSIINPFKGA